MGSRARPLNKMPMKTYQVIGRSAPTDAVPEPKLYKMKLFAPNEVVAKSRYWYFLSQIVKAKKNTGEIVSVKEIFEKKTDTIKNYGILLKYDSRSGTHNMYKEFRDTTLCGAVDQLYSEMAGRHRSRFRSIQIISTGIVKAADVKRTNVKQFINSKIKFPLQHRILRDPSKRTRSIYKAARPTTFFG